MPYTQVTALWTGFTGAPGYTRMKWNSELPDSDVALALGKMRTFFSGVAAFIPSSVRIGFDTVAQYFNDERQLTGEIAVTPPASVSGTATGGYSAASGAVVDWLTNDFVNGRRLRGRSFIVPLGGNAFDTDGTLTSTVLTAMTTAASNLVAGDPLLVINGGTPGARITRVATDANVPDRAAVLRSRRD